MDNAKFTEALKIWNEAQERYIVARELYRTAWAAKFLENDGMKPESARKAATDVATSSLRAERDQAELAAASAWQTLLVVRGPTDFSRQPGQNFGDAA